MSHILGIFFYNNCTQSREEYLVQAIHNIPEFAPISQSYNTYHRSAICTNPQARTQAKFLHIPTKNITVCVLGELSNYQEFLHILPHKNYQHEDMACHIVAELYGIYNDAVSDKIITNAPIIICDYNLQKVILIQDRIGQQPLYYTLQNDYVAFSSHLSLLMQLPINKVIDKDALALYFQLSYIPAPLSMISEVKKLSVAEKLIASHTYCNSSIYYSPTKHDSELPYKVAQQKVKEQIITNMHAKLRTTKSLVSFLSGGVDSSIVSALLAKEYSDLQTFSLRFERAQYIDESWYAQKMADTIGSKHTVITVSEHDFLRYYKEYLTTIDEPFADSSALAMHALCKNVASYTSVAFSGDGADEIFGGYRKHKAHVMAAKKSLINTCAAFSAPLLRSLPQSRAYKYTDIVRKILRYAHALNMQPPQRYWAWCSRIQEADLQSLLTYNYNSENFKYIKRNFTHTISEEGGLQDILTADQQLVLPYDMCMKVAYAARQHAVHIHSPFVQHELMELANSLPASYKIGGGLQKRILIDAFSDILPSEIYKRPKQGFEIPIEQIALHILHSDEAELLSKERVEQTGLLSYNYVKKIKAACVSSSPEDAPSQLWSVLIFMKWWSKNFL